MSISNILLMLGIGIGFVCGWLIAEFEAGEAGDF